MSTQSLDCPNCGAPLRNPANASTVICGHCGSMVAIHAQGTPAAAERPDYGTPSPDPTFQRGPKPTSQPERSSLTSLTLGSEDARHIVQLLRDRQRLEAIQFYHSKVGGSLGEAKAAIEAIESGLRDASAPLPPASATSSPFDIANVRDLLAAGNKIAAIKAYRDATSTGLREAAAAVDGMERQLYPGRARPTTVQTNAGRFAGRGCVAGAGLIVTFIICIFGGCGTFMQTQAIYRCTMREIKAVLASQEIFDPPVDGGYLVFAPGFEMSGGFDGWHLNAEFFAPVWGANNFGIVYSHVAADNDGWNSVSARLYTRGGSRVLFPGHTLDCEE
jgi:ribosomal protein L7/L12